MTLGNSWILLKHLGFRALPLAFAGMAGVSSALHWPITTVVLTVMAIVLQDVLIDWLRGEGSI